MVKNLRYSKKIDDASHVPSLCPIPFCFCLWTNYPEIPSGETVKLGYPDHNNLAITLKNKNSFGLETTATVTIAVDPIELLEIKNTSDKSVQFEYRIGLKTHVLLIVDSTIAEGAIIKVGKLLIDKNL